MFQRIAKLSKRRLFFSQKAQTDLFFCAKLRFFSNSPSPVQRHATPMMQEKCDRRTSVFHYVYDMAIANFAGRLLV